MKIAALPCPKKHLFKFEIGHCLTHELLRKANYKFQENWLKCLLCHPDPNKWMKTRTLSLFHSNSYFYSAELFPKHLLHHSKDIQIKLNFILTLNNFTCCLSSSGGNWLTYWFVLFFFILFYFRVWVLVCITSTWWTSWFSVSTFSVLGNESTRRHQPMSIKRDKQESPTRFLPTKNTSSL